MVAFFVNILPMIELALTCTLLFIGFALTVTAFVQLFYSKRNYLTETKHQMNFKIVERRTGIL